MGGYRGSGGSQATLEESRGMAHPAWSSFREARSCGSARRAAAWPAWYVSNGVLAHCATGLETIESASIRAAALSVQQLALNIT